jgi:hypothetical protein
MRYDITVMGAGNCGSYDMGQVMAQASTILEGTG